MWKYILLLGLPYLAPFKVTSSSVYSATENSYKYQLSDCAKPCKFEMHVYINVECFHSMHQGITQLYHQMTSLNMA